MDDRLTAFEARLARLEDTVETLRHEVVRLRDSATGPGGIPRATEREAATAAAGESKPDLQAILAMAGRLLLAMGGGFLLRAATEAGVLPQAGGVALGLVYAGAWVAAAHRPTAGPLAATFHAGAAAATGFPLVWEATLRFRVFGPWAAAGALALLTGVALWVAWHRRRQGVAWVLAVAACATCIALTAGTGKVVPFGIVLIALGTVTLWMGYSLDWVGLRWPVAVVVNVVVSALTVRAFSQHPAEPVGVTLAMQGFLAVAYLGSIGIRTLVKRRNVVPFEVVQTLAVLVVGVAGAVAVAIRTGATAWAVGILCLATGATAYGTGFQFMRREPVLTRNVYYYTSLALAFLLAGTSLAWSGTTSALAWMALSLGAAVWWLRTSRSVLLIHAAVYLAAAMVGTGLFGFGLQTIFARAPEPWGALPWSRLALLATATAVAAVVSRAHQAELRMNVAPRVALVLALLWTGVALAVGAAAPVVAARVPGAFDPGALAALRTTVLSVAALAVAWVGRRPASAEWSWFVYPLLIVGGLRMVLMDLAVSSPANLFVAFAAYGTALMLAPRLKGRRVSAAAS